MALQDKIINIVLWHDGWWTEKKKKLVHQSIVIGWTPWDGNPGFNKEIGVLHDCLWFCQVILLHENIE